MNVKKNGRNILSAILIALLGISTSISTLAKPANQKTQTAVKKVPANVLQTINARSNNVIAFYKKQSPQFGKNEASIEALEQIATLHLMRPKNAKQNNDFIQSYGAFYGQTLIQLFGGKWVYANGGLAIRNKNGIIVYPYATIRNRLSVKKENSILREMQIYKNLSQKTADQIKQSLKKKAQQTK